MNILPSCPLSTNLRHTDIIWVPHGLHTACQSLSYLGLTVRNTVTTSSQLCIVQIQFMSSRATLVPCPYTAVSNGATLCQGGQAWQGKLVSGRCPELLNSLTSLMPLSHLCEFCFSWAMAMVSSSTDQWHFTNLPPMGITSTSAASWRNLVASFLEMGTMAAWFGCLIMLQLLLFMSKGTFRNNCPTNDLLHLLHF